MLVPAVAGGKYDVVVVVDDDVAGDDDDTGGDDAFVGMVVHPLQIFHNDDADNNRTICKEIIM